MLLYILKIVRVCVYASSFSFFFYIFFTFSFSFSSFLSSLFSFLFIFILLWWFLFKGKKIIMFFGYEKHLLTFKKKKRGGYFDKKDIQS